MASAGSPSGAPSGELCGDGRLQRQQGRGHLGHAGKGAPDARFPLRLFRNDGRARPKSQPSHPCSDRQSQCAAIRARVQAEALIRFDRLLEDDGRPMTLETSGFDGGALSRCGRDGRRRRLFFAALRDMAGIEPAHAERQIDVNLASASERAILSVSAASPVYRIEKIVTDRRGAPARFVAARSPQAIWSPTRSSLKGSTCMFLTPPPFTRRFPGSF
ncbi:UTRA domain-containing protein (plasmid) [Sinorhizobium meliloti]|nr:UTRA domain-containing protein [Sinorhizobium meliloti]